jgi:uncharacterized protein
MEITPLIPKGRQVLTGYGGGGFKINNELVQGSQLIFPERLLAWDVQDPSQITYESLLPVLEPEGEVELLLVGTGKSMALFDPVLRQRLKDRRIAVDVMDTGAACRTYNVLLAEERKVAAAIIAV